MKKDVMKKEEWIWVTGYKGTDSNMMCRDQQYEIGKTYVMPENSDIKVCKSGFHLCVGLVDVFDYYSICNGNRFFEVKALVRKSDYDNIAPPKTTYHRYNFGYYNYMIPSYRIDPMANTIIADAPKDNKLSAKSIEFVRELTADEIFENTYGKDWSREDKLLALTNGIASVYDMIEERNRKKEQEEKENTLVELGYSRPFAAFIINNKKYDAAYAVGTQLDLSMDMKVLTIFR